ncbi:DUF397 domain-containing protein [Embleya sp. NPDC059237]|uniref:DUF397 domain-containing protein n=1 Tax=Embleya sp. NPDC059237 TaxID=3346784 RepID=UPI00367E0151
MTETNQTPWRTASYSVDNNNCVEVAPLPSSTGIRDTKDRALGHLEVRPGAWRELLCAIKE